MSTNNTSNSTASKSPHVDFSKISDIRENDPKKVPATDPLKKDGAALARLILYMICGITVLLIFCIAWSELVTIPKDIAELHSYIKEIYSHQNANSAADFGHATSLIESVKLARAESRELWMSIFQLVMVNILFPVLTAVIGYIFGSNNSGN